MSLIPNTALFYFILLKYISIQKNIVKIDKNKYSIKTRLEWEQLLGIALLIVGIVIKNDT